jgi:hypothetical protein
MTNYVQSTNFATKDALSSGNALKIVKGTEINTEYANIAIAVATKADLVSPTFTGTPLAPTAATATNTTQLATTAFVQAVVQLLHPVGSIYSAIVSTNPATLFGFGTWTAFGAGRMLISLDSTNALFNTAEETGGAADATLPTHTHTATVTDPGHSHTIQLIGDTLVGTEALRGSGNLANTPSTSTAFTSITVANANAGVSGTNANYPPFIAVYMWKRTA